MNHILPESEEYLEQGEGTFFTFVTLVKAARRAPSDDSPNRRR